MGVISFTPRAVSTSADQEDDRFDARLTALSRTSKRPVGKRPSLFERVKSQPTPQEA